MSASRPPRVLIIVAGLLICSCHVITAQREDEDVSNALTAVDIIRLGDPDDDMIIGTAGNDYPTYADVPNTAFSCRQQGIPGYYADTETQCQVFHICVTQGRRLEQFSFLCPNGTVFNQQYLVCVWWYDFNCALAPSLYNVNANLFKSAGATPTSLSNNFIDGATGTAAASAPRGQPASSRFPGTPAGADSLSHFSGVGGRPELTVGLPTSAGIQDTKGGFPTSASRPATTGRLPTSATGLDASGGLSTSPGRPGGLGTAEAFPQASGRPGTTDGSGTAGKLPILADRPNIQNSFPKDGPGTTGRFSTSVDRPGTSGVISYSADGPGTSEGITSSAGGAPTSVGRPETPTRFSTSAGIPDTTGALPSTGSKPSTTGRFPVAAGRPSTTGGFPTSEGYGLGTPGLSTVTGGQPGSTGGFPTSADGSSIAERLPSPGISRPSTVGNFPTSSVGSTITGKLPASAERPSTTGGFTTSTGPVDGISSQAIGLGQAGQFPTSVHGSGTIEITPNLVSGLDSSVTSTSGQATGPVSAGAFQTSPGGYGSTGHPGSTTGSTGGTSFAGALGTNVGTGSGLRVDAQRGTSLGGIQSAGQLQNAFGQSEPGSGQNIYQSSQGGSGTEQTGSGGLQTQGQFATQPRQTGLNYGQGQNDLVQGQIGVSSGQDHIGLRQKPIEKGYSDGQVGQPDFIHGTDLRTVSQGSGQDGPGTEQIGSGGFQTQGQFATQPGQTGLSYGQGQNDLVQGQIGVSSGQGQISLDQKPTGIGYTEGQVGQTDFIHGIDLKTVNQVSGQDGPSTEYIGSGGSPTQGQFATQLGQTGLGYDQEQNSLVQGQIGVSSDQGQIGLGQQPIEKNYNEGQVGQTDFIHGTDLRTVSQDSGGIIHGQSELGVTQTQDRLGQGHSGQGFVGISQGQSILDQSTAIPNKIYDGLSQSEQINVGQGQSQVAQGQNELLQGHGSFVSGQGQGQSVLIQNDFNAGQHDQNIDQGENKFDQGGIGFSGKPSQSQNNEGYSYPAPATSLIPGSGVSSGSGIQDRVQEDTILTIQNQETQILTKNNNDQNNYNIQGSGLNRPQDTSGIINNNANVLNVQPQGHNNANTLNVQQQATGIIIKNNDNALNVQGNKASHAIQDSTDYQRPQIDVNSFTTTNNKGGETLLIKDDISSGAQFQSNQNQLVTNKGSGNSGRPQPVKVYTSNPLPNNLHGLNSSPSKPNTVSSQTSNNVSPEKFNDISGIKFTTNPSSQFSIISQGDTSTNNEYSPQKQSINVVHSVNKPEILSIPGISISNVSPQDINSVSINAARVENNLGNTNNIASDSVTGINNIPVDITQQLQYVPPSKEFSSSGSSNTQQNDANISQSPQNEIFITNTLSSTAPVLLTNSLKQEVVAPITQAETSFTFPGPQNGVSTVDLKALQQGYLPPKNEVSQVQSNTFASSTGSSSSTSFSSSSPSSSNLPSSSSSPTFSVKEVSQVQGNTIASVSSSSSPYSNLPSSSSSVTSSVNEVSHTPSNTIVSSPGSSSSTLFSSTLHSSNLPSSSSSANFPVNEVSHTPSNTLVSSPGSSSSTLFSSTSHSSNLPSSSSSANFPVNEVSHTPSNTLVSSPGSSSTLFSSTSHSSNLPSSSSSANFPVNQVSQVPGNTIVPLGSNPPASFSSSSSHSFKFPSSSSSASSGSPLTSSSDTTSYPSSSQGPSVRSNSFVLHAGFSSSNPAVGSSPTNSGSFLSSLSSGSSSSSNVGVSNTNVGVSTSHNLSPSLNQGYLPPVTDFTRNARQIGRGEYRIFVTPLPREEIKQSNQNQQSIARRAFRPSVQITEHQKSSEFSPKSTSKPFGRVFFPSNRRSDSIPITYVDNSRRSFIASSSSPFNPYNKYNLSWRS